MNVYVCMPVCMYVCTYACMHVFGGHACHGVHAEVRRQPSGVGTLLYMWVLETEHRSSGLAASTLLIKLISPAQNLAGFAALNNYTFIYNFY